MAEQRNDARVRLRKAIDDRLERRSDIAQFLDRCRDACMIAQLTDQATWFWRESLGYWDGDEWLPDYRRSVPGMREIAAQDSELNQSSSEERMIAGILKTLHPQLGKPVEQVFRPVRVGLGDVIKFAKDGSWDRDSDWFTYVGPENAQLKRAPTPRNYRWIVRFPPDSFQRLLASIDIAAQVRARRIEVELSYGDAVQDIWDEQRAITEPAIANLGLEQHLEEIRNGIRGQNPESWRSAMHECRSLLEHLADFLWQDPRAEHPCLRDTKNNARVVKQGATKNRLQAYLHCKGTRDNESKAVETDLNAVLEAAPRIYDLASTTHKTKPVDRDDARLTVIQTYIFLSQLVQRTDLQPVTDADVCCKPGAARP